MKKRKVYIFSGTSRAAVYGIGTYITQLADCLGQAQIEFEVVHLYAEGNEVTVTEDKGYRQISIPAIKSSNKNTTQYYSRNVAYLLREFIPTDSNFTYIFHLNFMTDSRMVMQLKKIFKSKVILTIHYTNWSFDLLGNYEILKKILKTSKDKLNPFEKNLLEAFKEDVKMIKECDKSIYIAKHTSVSFAENSEIDKEKTIIINNGLEDLFKKNMPIEINKIKKKYRIDKNSKIILFAGRLDPVKGVSYLIKSFKSVLEKHSNCYLFFIGDGDFNVWLKDANSYWTRIIFTGRLNKEQLYEFYQIADMGVVCSLHEEFGYVAIEMMMHQLPIIVSNTGGLAEIVEDNISGLKVPIITEDEKRFIDVTILTEQICYLIEYPQIAKRLGKNARTRYLEKFELSQFKRQMLDLYQNI